MYREEMNDEKRKENCKKFIFNISILIHIAFVFTANNGKYSKIEVPH
jgi:hypothetical protein